VLFRSTWIAELRHGEIHEYSVTPEQFGFARCASEHFSVADISAAKDRLLLALSGKPGPEQDIVALNAGTALLASDIALSLGEGIHLARQALASGAAMAKLQALAAFQ
jgi:anthranilate phosphoribosyltransferase